MANGFVAINYPELVFGIAGAIGIDIEEINRTLTEALASVSYQAVPIRITVEIEDEVTNVPQPAGNDFGSQISYKMSHASEVCRKYKSPDTLMRFAIRAIRNHRAANFRTITDETEIGGVPERDLPVPEEAVIPRSAYIIRQLKRPEEVELLRKVYGKQFVLISAYGTIENRRRVIENALRRSLPLNRPDHEISSEADRLIHRDQNEESDTHGQHLRDTFHLADVFIDGNSKAAMDTMATRFIDALFGRSDIAPTKWEYGMYAAKSASLRSSDLSRQVGAAIFSREGELIVQGCNEVPKAFGGTYWDGEDPDYRDIRLGHDPNDLLKKELVRDLLERLLRGGMLSENATKIGSAAAIVDALMKKPADGQTDLGYGSLVGAAVMELTEYGRVVHAEMCAICDAARLGRSLKGGILFCTTFPCHNCTKHLLAAGISRVVYMEPYPKSKAKELHEHEIEIEKRSETRVSFLPFLGISPLRYRDIFQKGKRKRDGVALRWLASEPRPLIDISAPTYIDLESFELSKLHGAFRSISGDPSPDVPVV
jgi:deoxycytidylate deaminase